MRAEDSSDILSHSRLTNAAVGWYHRLSDGSHMTKRTSPSPKHPPARSADRSAELEAELSELRTGWQRTQADFENFRRRVIDEQASIRNRVAVETLLELVPILDNLRRAFASLPKQENGWATGFRHIAKQLEDLLARHRLEQIPTVGEPFNPTLHEAISQMPHPSHAADTVIDEIESGYRHAGTIVKPAKVVVSTGPANAKVQHPNDK